MNTTLSDAAMWAIIVGFLSPLVLSVIQQPSWGTKLQTLVAFVFSLVAGTGTAYFTGGLSNVTSLVTTILLVLVATISFYKGFWKPSGVAGSIETATSPVT